MLDPANVVFECQCINPLPTNLQDSHWSAVCYLLRLALFLFVSKGVGS
jgi:hypothetical protein